MTHPTPDGDELVALLRRSLQDEAPPASVSARAIALHGAGRRLAGTARALWRRLVAEPASAAGSTFEPALGVRGQPEPQHWLLRAEECEIDLRISPHGENWTISGQLFGAQGAQQVLLSGPRIEATAKLGETSEFTFGDLPPGRYSVTIKAPQLDIVVPQFDVGDAAEADHH